MKLLQLGTSLQRLFSRKFASNATAAISSSNLKTKKNTTKSGTNDVSKMPQPHPVLTPLARTSADQLAVDQLPAIEAVESCDKFIHRIELGNELQKRLTKGLSEVADHFGGNLFILRKELVKQVKEALKESDLVLLDGPNGSGKSVLLMQIYAALKESIKGDEKKLILYAPNVHKWTTGYFAYYPTEQVGEYKQPELALEILRLLLICNAKEKLPVDLAEQINEAKLDAYNRALPLYEKTMKELLNDKELYLLLDGVNGLIDGDSLTGYTDREGNALPLNSLPLCNDFFGKSVGNKRVIGATTKSNPALPRVPQNGFKSVNVSNYSAEELKQILQLYSQLGHCSANKSEQFVAFKAFVSGSNGRKLYKSCEYDSIYYKNN